MEDSLHKVHWGITSFSTRYKVFHPQRVICGTGKDKPPHFSFVPTPSLLRVSWRVSLWEESPISSPLSGTWQLSQDRIAWHSDSQSHPLDRSPWGLNSSTTHLKGSTSSTHTSFPRVPGTLEGVAEIGQLSPTQLSSLPKVLVFWKMFCMAEMRSLSWMLKTWNLSSRTSK